MVALVENPDQDLSVTVLAGILRVDLKAIGNGDVLDRIKRGETVTLVADGDGNWHETND